MRSFFIRFLPVCLVCITSGSVSAQMVGTKGNLTISDETLQHVWSRAFEGFWARDGYSSELATASYSLYSPDPVPMLRAHYYLESSVSIPRSILSRSFAPSGDTGGGSAEYSLHWPVLLEQYHRFRGDDDYVRAMCESALPVWLEHFEGQLSDEGLLRTSALDEDPILAGIEIVVDGESESAVINMLYYRAVIAMARLHRELGMESDHWKEKADGLRAAILKNFWSDDLDLFVDNPGSDHASIAANALAVCLGLSDTIEEAVSLIRREGAACSTLFVPYVVEACFLADEHQLAIDL